MATPCSTLTSRSRGPSTPTGPRPSPLLRGLVVVRAPQVVGRQGEPACDLCVRVCLTMRVVCVVHVRKFAYPHLLSTIGSSVAGHTCV
jgi:hypothetical protein